MISALSRLRLVFVGLCLAVVVSASVAANIAKAQETSPTDCRVSASSPELVAKCLVLLNINVSASQSCPELQSSYKEAMGEKVIATPASCEVLAKAVERNLGTLPDWASCLGDGVGTSDHVAACISGSSGPELQKMGCAEIRSAYALALGRAGRAAGAALRCDIAASAIQKATGGGASWGACLSYVPGEGHERRCLAGKTAEFSSCGEAIGLYERLLKSAYAGNLPNRYRVPGCDEFEPLLSEAISAAAAQREAQAQSERPVVISSPPRAAASGSTASQGATNLVIFAVGLVLVMATPALIGMFVRDKLIGMKIRNSEVLRTQRPLADEAAVRRMAREKQGEFAYSGSLDMNFPVDLAGEAGTAKLIASFRLVRNLAAMTHREREFVRIYQLMRLRGWIPAEADIRIHLGLAYGDGKAVIEGDDFRVSTAVRRQHGITNIADAVRWYAKNIGVNTESAISELLNILGQISAQFQEDPLVKEIAASLASGGRWFSEADLPGSPLIDDGTDGLFLGLNPWDEDSCSFYGEGSLITIAPPGAGKTQTHIIPNLFFWKGPAIVLDIKGELWQKTSAFRQTLGPIYRFAPFEPDRSHHYNPLTAIRTDPDLLWEDCIAAATLMVVPQASKDPFWEQTAQRTLAGFIAYVCLRNPDPDARSMADILDLAAGVGLNDYLDWAKTATDIRQLRREASGLEQLSETTLGGVLGQLQTTLMAWSGGRIERTTSRSDWLPLDIREQNATLYICVRPDEIEPALSLLRVFIGQHIRNLTSKISETAKDVLFLLDEFPQLRKMTPIEDGISVGRSYGVRLWLIAQSLSQIRTHYKERADGMIGQCGIRAYMNPSLQDGTAQKLSEDIGTFESVIDGHKQPIADPQMLAGPEFANDVIVFARSTKPLRLKKAFAVNTPDVAAMMGEVEWPPNAGG